MLVLASSYTGVIQSNETGVLEVKKVIIIACIAASAFIILDSMNAAHALFMFFLAGIIPGTNIAVSATQMLEIFAVLIGFTLSRITSNLVRLSLTPRIDTPTPRARAARA